MEHYKVVKVFDLSRAPSDLLDSEDLAPLRSTSPEDGSLILTLKVGRYESLTEGPIDDRIMREITLTEFRLHQWLAQEGAAEGESVLLHWNGVSDW